MLYALPFAIFGLFHFLNAETVAAQVPLPGGMVRDRRAPSRRQHGDSDALVRELGAFGLTALLGTFILFSRHIELSFETCVSG